MKKKGRALKRRCRQRHDATKSRNAIARLKRHKRGLEAKSRQYAYGKLTWRGKRLRRKDPFLFFFVIIIGIIALLGICIQLKHYYDHLVGNVN
jgi:hypothetical protein